MEEFEERPIIDLKLPRKKVYGVGINDSDYMTSRRVGGVKIRCPYYQRWVNMLMRCYNPQYVIKHPTYEGCNVCEEWLVFSNFKDWMKAQEWEGKHLDKDLLVKGNKIYNPETCTFVTPQINSLLATNKSKGVCSQGVYYHKRDRRYVSRCSDENGLNIVIGYYVEEKDAFLEYCRYKSEVIKRYSEKEADERIKNALMRESLLLLQCE